MSVSWSHLLADGKSPAEWAEKVREGRYLPWVSALKELAAGSPEVLSLGSGIGDVEAVLARSGSRVTALDVSEENVVFARSLFKSLSLDGEFRTADIKRPLPFADGAFDTVYSCTVLQFFSDEEIRAVLKEAFRVSRRRVIVILPNARCLLYRIGKWHLERTGRWPWGAERPRATLKPLFMSAGAGEVDEFSVTARHALDFLKMRGSGVLKRIMTPFLGPADSPSRARFRQGYMLVCVGDKEAPRRS